LRVPVFLEEAGCLEAAVFYEECGRQFVVEVQVVDGINKYQFLKLKRSNTAYPKMLTQKACNNPDLTSKRALLSLLTTTNVQGFF
jgi:hypothetical protein